MVTFGDFLNPKNVYFTKFTSLIHITNLLIKSMKNYILNDINIFFKFKETFNKYSNLIDINVSLN